MAGATATSRNVTPVTATRRSRACPAASGAGDRLPRPRPLISVRRLCQAFGVGAASVVGPCIAVIGVFPTACNRVVSTTGGAAHDERRGNCGSSLPRRARPDRRPDRAAEGSNVETEELPAYCAVALAGLDDLPHTIMTRSVVIRMRRRGPHEHIEPWRWRVNGPEAAKLSDRLRQWSNDNQHRIGVTWPVMPDGIEDRDADVWAALLMVADLAGGN